MDAESAVPVLARQQRPHHRTIEDLASADGLLAEQVPPGQQANRRLGRGEQPADRGTGLVVHRPHAAIMVIQQPGHERPAGYAPPIPERPPRPAPLALAAFHVP
jgi:hypothetical protein